MIATRTVVFHVCLLEVLLIDCWILLPVCFLFGQPIVLVTDLYAFCLPHFLMWHVAIFHCSFRHGQNIALSSVVLLGIWLWLFIAWVRLYQNIYDLSEDFYIIHFILEPWVFNNNLYELFLNSCVFAWNL